MKLIKFFAIIIITLAFVSKAACQDYQVKDGLKYKIYKSNPGPKPVKGDVVMVDLLFFLTHNSHDSLVFSSLDRKQLMPIPIGPSQFQGDLMQGVKMLSVGDSAVFLISGDSIKKIAGPSGASIEAGSWMKYVIKVHSIFNPDVTDENLITEYIKKNKIKGMKRTADGLYYKVTEEGKGDLPKAGQKITAHYTGKLLDGTTFDSDKGAGFSFTLGAHGVIEGWDEGFALLKKGSKATLLIPSKLAYGPRGSGPIPANAVLLFEVELVDAQ